MWMSAKCNPETVGSYVVMTERGGETISKWDGTQWGRKGVKYWQLKEPRPIPWEPSQTPYFNTETKQQIALIAGMQGCCEQLLENPRMRNATAVHPLLREAGQRFHAALDILFAGTGADQAKAVINLVKCSTIRVCPKSTELDENWVVCDVNDINLLGTMAAENAECCFCQANKYEVKRCELRKCLLRMGATGKEETLDCPFKGVM